MEKKKDLINYSRVAVNAIEIQGLNFGKRRNVSSTSANDAVIVKIRIIIIKIIYTCIAVVVCRRGEWGQNEATAKDIIIAIVQALDDAIQSRLALTPFFSTVSQRDGL